MRGCLKTRETGGKLRKTTCPSCNPNLYPFLHTGGIPHGTKRVILRAYAFAYHKHFALFHFKFRGTQKCVGFLSISAEPWGPLSLKILLDEITLEAYDRPGSKKYFAKLFIGL